tara:strand:+ start:5281 stop:5700 length:420 start_codon:yes stop_codon:yes gene_type:complete
MKKVLKNVGKFLIGLLLFITSIGLATILLPWGLVEILIQLFWKKRFWEGLGMLGELILLFATLVDVAGNVILQVPLNRVFNNDGYKFGSRFDTISFVLGHGEFHGTLTKKGKWMCNFLNNFEKDHCLKTYHNRFPYNKP